MKLVSCNIEGHKHLESRVIPFLQKEDPDIICLQEVFKVDVPLIEQATNMKAVFVPMADVLNENPYLDVMGEWGVVQLTRLPVLSHQLFWYVGTPGKLPEFFKGDEPNSMNRVVSALRVSTPHGERLIATTHFTWSPNGSTTQLQHENLDALLERIGDWPTFILCGDFNAPRGEAIFTRLAATLKDHIPATETSSIDGQFHKAGALELMVDGLFSTGDYQIRNVSLKTGISDHRAIIAEVL